MIRALQTSGFIQVSQRGSHIKLKKRTDAGELVVIVLDYRELAEGTLSSILHQARLSRKELEDLL